MNTDTTVVTCLYSLISSRTYEFVSVLPRLLPNAWIDCVELLLTASLAPNIDHGQNCLMATLP